MLLSIRRASLALVLIVFAADAVAEPGWLTKWKAYIDEHILVSDDGNGGTTTGAEPEKTEAAPPTPRSPVLQAGNPGEFKLPGNWTLTSNNGRKEIGTLRADGRYFTLKISDPKIELRTAYMQAEDGAFRCTVLDKQVISMEGRFENPDRIDFQVQVKDIGRPAIKRYAFVAKRGR